MTSLIANPEQFIFAQESELKTTSLKVAEAFKKQHKHVMRDIKKIIATTPQITSRRVAEVAVDLHCYKALAQNFELLIHEFDNTA